MSEPLLTRPFVMLALSDLAYFTAAGVLLLATPLFAAGPLGADPAGVGLAMGSFSLTTLLLRPWIGRWTDRHGRRTLLVGGAAAMPGMPQLAGPSDMEHRLDIARIEGQVKASSVKKVADFVEKHPDESTSILRSWVHEG